jgi:hypothetical protein
MLFKNMISMVSILTMHSAIELGNDDLYDL